MRKQKWLVLVGLIFVGFMGLAGCAASSQSRTSSQTKIQVVTSLDFYGEVARQVVGHHGTVTSFINSPNVDPHDFEPTATNAKQVADASVVLTNGLGYDAWLDKLVNANQKQGTQIKVSTLMQKKDGDNEHLWYDLAAMQKLTRKLVQVFSQKQPQHAAEFRRNGQAYLKKLAQVEALEDQLSVSGKPAVAVTEPVFDYALKRLGYRITNNHFAKAIEDGTDPSPADIANLQADIKQHKIKFLVENTQTEDKIILNLVDLAKKAGIPILKVTETLPKNKTYLSWMRDQFQQLERIQASHD